MLKVIFSVFVLMLAMQVHALADEEDNRRIYVAVEPLGFGPNSTVSHGLRLGFPIWVEGWSGDWISIETQFVSPYGGDYSDNLESSAVGVHYSRFFGRSFYLNGGINGRTYSVYNLHKGGSSTANPHSISGKMIDASLAIGNLWQQRYITIGVDWIGCIQPITATGAQDDSAFSNNFANTTSFELLRAYFGLSF